MLHKVHLQNSIARCARRLSLLGALLLLCACTYDVAPPAMPSLEVPSGFTNKVNGTWALVIDKEVMTAHIDPPGVACGAFDYPIDMNTTFQRSLVQVFRQVADEIVLSDHKLSGAELKTKGYAGQIEFGELAFTPGVKFNQISLTAKVNVSIELDATMTVRNPAGVLLVKRFSADTGVDADAGIICQDAARAITRAVGTAVQQVVVNSASTFGNSRDIRLFSALWQPSRIARSQ